MLTLQALHTIEIKISAWQYLHPCTAWATKASKFFKLFA